MRTKKKKTVIKSEVVFYLPEECWEHIFTFLINGDKNKFHFKSLSLVSKHFHSLTNRLLFSLSISDPFLSLITPLFHRFSNLNSLNLNFSSVVMPIFKVYSEHFIDSLVSLKCLNSLCLASWKISDDLLYAIVREDLPLTSLVLQDCTGYTYHGIYSLLSKCQTIQHLGIYQDCFINNHHIADLSLVLPHLVSIDLTLCPNLTESALFELITNCHSLTKIIMRCIRFGNSHSLKDLDFDVNPQVKSLFLESNVSLDDETIIMFTSVLPNLQFLHLSYCRSISEKGVISVVQNCTELKEIFLRTSGEDDDVLIPMVLSAPSLNHRKLSSRDGIIYFY